VSAGFLSYTGFSRSSHVLITVIRSWSQKQQDARRIFTPRTISFTCQECEFRSEQELDKLTCSDVLSPNGHFVERLRVTMSVTRVTAESGESAEH